MLQFSAVLLLQVIWIALFGSSAAVIVERVTYPAPIVVQPSQSFDGNDGPFSSFNISVGNPPQQLKVFISTSIWRTLVVLKEGCPTTSPTCAALRGGEFAIGESTSWQNNTAKLGQDVYEFRINPSLEYRVRAKMGFDDLSLAGSAGIVLRNQTVGGFALNDTFLGLFGLDPRASNFTGQPPIPSYLQNLRDQSLIPSLSWGYTAGNPYRSKDKSFGSLTIGGYDRSRLVQHDASWPIDGPENRLTVQLESIFTERDGSRQGLLATPISAVLDSSLPYIWLPIEVCTLFELEFGLKWNNDSKLYLVDDAMHTALVQRNASLTFNLGGMSGGSTTSVNITLPYMALDLTASSPLISKPTRYYPLKRAENSTQYILGRTFFQEAFVVADYERRNFSVYPCKWEDESKTDIVSVLSPSYGTTPEAAPGSPANNSTSKSSGGSSKAGPIAGGVIGGIALLAAIIAVLFYFCYIKPKQRKNDYVTHGEKTEMAAPLPDNPALALEDNPHLHKAELAATQRLSDMAELEGSAGVRRISEMPVREAAASEMRAIDNHNMHEMSTPEAIAEATATTGGFPWKANDTPTETPDGGQSTSPLQSPGIMSRVSPLSSPGLPSPVPSQSTIAASLPSPVPSPPPVLQPQPQRVVTRKALDSIS